MLAPVGLTLTDEGERFRIGTVGPGELVFLEAGAVFSLEKVTRGPIVPARTKGLSGVISFSFVVTTVAERDRTGMSSTARGTGADSDADLWRRAGPENDVYISPTSVA